MRLLSTQNGGPVLNETLIVSIIFLISSIFNLNKILSHTASLMSIFNKLIRE